MTPPPPQEFVAGPPVHPADELLRWLDSRSTGARGTLLKVPVVVVFDGPERLSIREAFIGASAADAGRDALALRLDDGAMGRALVDTLRERCPGSASTCALWLEGHWGSLVRAPADAARRTFSVRRVGALVAAEEARPLRVFVAGQ